MTSGSDDWTGGRTLSGLRSHRRMTNPADGYVVVQVPQSLPTPSTPLSTLTWSALAQLARAMSLRCLVANGDSGDSHYHAQEAGKGNVGGRGDTETRGWSGCLGRRGAVVADRARTCCGGCWWGADVSCLSNGEVMTSAFSILRVKHNSNDNYSIFLFTDIDPSQNCW